MPDAGTYTTYDILKEGGPAAVAFLAIAALCVVFRLWCKDQAYIREQDKNTLNVLNELTQVIADASTANTTGFAEIRGAIQHAVDHIKGHMDANLRK